MNVLVVGWGSIGQRHAEVLEQLGHSIQVVSQRPKLACKAFASLQSALEEEDFGYIVISNKTSEHWETLKRVLTYRQFKMPILIEKPVVSHASVITEFVRSNEEERIFAGYNLRQHPALIKLREMLSGHKILSVQIYCGQYLPTWRPQRDYRQSYSAFRAEGGGVLRDLSHELDYMQWLFGPWKNVYAIGGKYSSLEIDSEDCCTILCQTSNVPVISVQLNYLDRRVQREIIINTDIDTFKVDLIAGELFQEGENGRQHYQFRTERNDTYLAMHTAILQHRTSEVCSFKEGLETVRLIEAIEKSMYTGAKQWNSES